MTIHEAIREAINIAKEKNYNLRNAEAKRVLKYVLGITTEELIYNSNNEITDTQQNTFFSCIIEIINGKPLQYITHSQEFLGSTFWVDENVLIPQPDTEILVEQAIKLCKERENNIQLLDLCTGSGAIAISIKKEIKDNITITASDISNQALEVAKKNEKNILKANSIKFIQSDMFKNIKGKFDIIVSNPPYIKSNIIHSLDKDVQNEPIIALDGGEDGLKYYGIIRNHIQEHLKPNGVLIMEIGFDQKNDVLSMFENAVCIKDYGNNDRLVIWKNTER